MGIDEYEDVLDVTLEEDSLFSVDFEHEYKKLYIYIDQSGVEGDKCSTIYFNPYSYIGNDGRKINSFSVYEQTSINFCNIGSIWESSGKVTTRISFAGNPQKIQPEICLHGLNFGIRVIITKKELVPHLKASMSQ